MTQQEEIKNVLKRSQKQYLIFQEMEEQIFQTARARIDEILGKELQDPHEYIFDFLSNQSLTVEETIEGLLKG